MKFTTGYSREHPGGQKWSKMDITLEEVDLKRFLAENDIDPEMVISPAVAFQLMWLEAERYMTIHQNAERLMGKDEATAKVEEFRQRQGAILAKIKESADGAV